MPSAPNPRARFESVGEDSLVLLRVAAKTDQSAEHPRYNLYGEALPSHLKENGGEIEIIPREGEFWGAEE